jgi:hypothetical protein
MLGKGNRCLSSANSDRGGGNEKYNFGVEAPSEDLLWIANAQHLAKKLKTLKDFR